MNVDTVNIDYIHDREKVETLKYKKICKYCKYRMYVYKIKKYKF